MANETEIGSLAINLQLKLEGLEKGLETAKKKLQSIEEENKKVEASNKNLEAGFVVLAATAVASLIQIKGAMDEAVEKYNEYNSANVGLKSVLDGQGKSFTKAQSFIQDYISDGLIPLSNATTAYKNLALRGYNDEQIKQVMINLKDAAAFGRQSTLEYGYSIQSATEGLKNMNPVLVDNAGVTKNMSIMYEEYASKIGKGVGSLTEEEKILAEVNGIKAETITQTGDAAKYAQEYAGQQAAANAQSLQLKQTLGESLIPTYTKLTAVQKDVLAWLNEMIKNNKVATAGITTLVVSILGISGATTAAVAGITMYKTAAAAANMTTKAFTASIMANPLFIGATILAIGISAINMFNTAMQESIEKMEEETEKSVELSEALQNFQKNSEYTSQEQGVVENARNEANEVIRIYEEKNNKIIELEQKKKDVINKFNSGEIMGFQKDAELSTLNSQLYDATEAFKKFKQEKMSDGRTIEEYRRKVDILSKSLDLNKAKQDYLTQTNIKAHRENLVNIAQTQADIEGKKKLLNVIKQGKTSTDEYKNAKTQLTKVYPELNKVNESTIKTTEDTIAAEEAAAKTEWALAQASITKSITDLAIMQQNKAQILLIAAATKQSVDEVTKSITTQINVLNELLQLSPKDFKVDTGSFSASSGSKSYQNKALDNYKKQIDYKKSLDQISLRDEINMYETALKRYAKTQDEKMELTTKLYELRKELTEKTLDDYTAQIDYEKSMGYISAQQEIQRYEEAYRTHAKTFEQKRDLEVKLHDMRQALEEETTQMLKEQADKEREILNQKAEDYKKYIEDQKNLRGAEYDVKEQEADLNKIIEMHRNYLNQLVKDTRYSVEEIESIRREELDVIRDLEQQKRDIMVKSINDTVSQLKSAIIKQIEEVEKADEEAIKKNMDAVEEWKNARIEAINEEYDARIKAIQDELNALDKSEEDKSRAEEDAEFERKKKRLEELAEFEHDATTKANYLKELAKLEADYQKTLDKRTLEDKKEALKEQQDLLKEEQQNKTDAVKEEADKQKEAYEKQLDELKDYYDKQKDMAQETAEKMLLNVQQNQEQILNLLNKYGDKYEITGQTLGEKLAQGINNSLANNIQNIIQTIQDRIDSAIENQISKWTNATYKYEQATSKAQVVNKSVVINQTNNIQQNPEMPSETYRKLKNLDRDLASSINI